MSDPRPTIDPERAISPPSPPLDPPEVLSLFQGFKAVPKIKLFDSNVSPS
jgi:hypothetical protein